ncbi:MAG: sigma-70 family RNA polymerase sigma factor [Deltaproteobacteria bacterium]|nr:sigma-70 family RNA polymerase sigma factor [Deltaproteobacteria bacterium]
MGKPLTTLFLSHIPNACDATGFTRLEPVLARIVAEARRAWPDVSLDAAVFVAHLASQCPRDAEIPAHLQSIAAADLYLACACANGDVAAHRAFDRAYLSRLPTLVRRLNLSKTLLDDVTQTLREKLLLARDGTPPKIAGFSGRGSLLAWLRVAAVRAAIDECRARPGLDPALVESVDETAIAGTDPELGFVRKRYGAEFQAAFRDAINALTSRQQTILRLYFLESLTVENLGRMYNVDKSTVSRWLHSTREELLATTKVRLQERLRLSNAEVGSLVRVLKSRLDLSIASALKPS